MASTLISSKKQQENYAAAEENYQKAKKKAGTTLLRWKPDWEAAAKYYREATKLFKISGGGHQLQTVNVLRESAIAHKEIGSFHTAAADLEAAATILRDDIKDVKEASALFAEAALYYRTQGSSHDKAAAVLVKAAEAIGDVDVNAGVELMKQACSIFEEDGRAVFHDQTFKKAVCFCVNHKKFGSARSLLQRQIVLAQQHLDTFEQDIYKNALMVVVLRFHTEDYEKAAEELQKFEQIARFAKSDYCSVANQMITAWEDGDAEAFTAACKSNTMKYLLNPIAVIARRMTMPEDQIKVVPKGKPAAATSSSSSASAPAKKPAAAAAASAARGKKVESDEDEGNDTRAEGEEDEEVDLR